LRSRRSGWRHGRPAARHYQRAAYLRGVSLDVFVRENPESIRRDLKPPVRLAMMEK
jgi:hypothetical protein